MKCHLTMLFSILSLSGFSYSSDGGTNELNNTNSVISQALEYDQAYADKGDIDALRRMEERYRDGDGVEADTNRAAEYNKKYEMMFQTEADRITEKARIAEQEALRQKFLKNLVLADKHNNVQSLLYLEKCYRYGIGTEKDSDKADACHAKAVSLGIPNNINTEYDMHEDDEYEMKKNP